MSEVGFLCLDASTPGEPDCDQAASSGRGTAEISRPQKILSVSGNRGLVIIGEINCQPLKFLIDTGVGVTLISKGIFQQLSQGLEGSLLEVPFDVCGADGSQLDVLGKDLMEITIGPLKVLHEVIVADKL